MLWRARLKSKSIFCRQTWFLIYNLLAMDDKSSKGYPTELFHHQTIDKHIVRLQLWWFISDQSALPTLPSPDTYLLLYELRSPQQSNLLCHTIYENDSRGGPFCWSSVWRTWSLFEHFYPPFSGPLHASFSAPSHEGFQSAFLKPLSALFFQLLP